MKKKSKELAASESAEIARVKASARSPRDAKPVDAARPGVNGASADGNAKAAVLPGQPKVKIDPEIQAMNLPLSAEEEAQLEANILSEGRPRDRLVVWKGNRILVDGHHRYAICKKHNLPFDVMEIDFADRAAVMDWIEKNQDGRRNTTPLGLSYRRGRRYNDEKRGHGGSRTGEKASGHSDPLRTDERLAAHYQRSAKTIRREGEFAAAVDLLASRCGDAIRRYILTAHANLTQKAVLRLSRLTEVEQREAVAHLLKTVKLPVPAGKRKVRMVRVRADLDDMAFDVVQLLNKQELKEFLSCVKKHVKQNAEFDAMTAP